MILLKTKARENYGYFSIPYRREMYVLYVWPDYHDKCRSEKLENLIQSGFRLSLSRGVVYGDNIARIQKNEALNRLIHYHSRSATLLKLFKANEIDGMVEDPMVMAFNQRFDDKLKEAKPCQISVSTDFISIMFSKKTVSQETVNRFNQAIEKVSKEAGYRQLWGI